MKGYGMRYLLLIFICLCWVPVATAVEHAEEDVQVFEEENEDGDEDREFKEVLDRAHRFLQQQHPEFNAMLLSLKQENGDQYFESMDACAWEIQEYLEMMEEDAGEETDEGNRGHRAMRQQRFALVLKEAQLRLQLKVLSNAYQKSHGKDKESLAVIKQTVPILFATLLERRRLGVAELKKELEMQSAELKELEENKDDIIQKKILDLSGRDILDW